MKVEVTTVRLGLPGATFEVVLGSHSERLNVASVRKLYAELDAALQEHDAGLRQWRDRVGLRGGN